MSRPLQQLPMGLIRPRASDKSLFMTWEVVLLMFPSSQLMKVCLRCLQLPVIPTWAVKISTTESWSTSLSSGSENMTGRTLPRT
uniref:Glucose-regulated protein n=1 Tax=Phakopsora pachyrhizi TaxID=170000 RepID=A0A0S1MK91_PHAPC